MDSGFPALKRSIPSGEEPNLWKYKQASIPPPREF